MEMEGFFFVIIFFTCEISNLDSEPGSLVSYFREFLSVFLDKFWRTLLEHIAAPAMTQ
jgi:hypothetical protein